MKLICIAKLKSGGCLHAFEVRRAGLPDPLFFLYEPLDAPFPRSWTLDLPAKP